MCTYLALLSPPVALALDVFTRSFAEIGSADDDDLEPLGPGLVASPRAGRDAHRVPLLELDDLVVELHPPAPAQDRDLLLRLVRVAVRKAIAGRSADLDPPPGAAEYWWAMSQENVVAIVEDAYEALASGGLDQFIEHWSDDLDHRAIKGAPDDPGPIHGKDAMRAYVQDWMDTFDEFWIEPVELIDAGDGVVVALLRFGGRAKLSGIEPGLRPSGSCSRSEIGRSRVAGSMRLATRRSKPPAVGVGDVARERGIVSRWDGLELSRPMPICFVSAGPCFIHLLDLSDER